MGAFFGDRGSVSLITPLSPQFNNILPTCCWIGRFKIVLDGIGKDVGLPLAGTVVNICFCPKLFFYHYLFCYSI